MQRNISRGRSVRRARSAFRGRKTAYSRGGISCYAFWESGHVFCLCPRVSNRQRSRKNNAKPQSYPTSGTQFQPQVSRSRQNLYNASRVNRDKCQSWNPTNGTRGRPAQDKKHIFERCFDWKQGGHSLNQGWRTCGPCEHLIWPASEFSLPTLECNFASKRSSMISRH